MVGTGHPRCASRSASGAPPGAATGRERRHASGAPADRTWSRGRACASAGARPERPGSLGDRERTVATSRSASSSLGWPKSTDQFLALRARVRVKRRTARLAAGGRRQPGPRRARAAGGSAGLAADARAVRRRPRRPRQPRRAPTAAPSGCRPASPSPDPRSANAPARPRGVPAGRPAGLRPRHGVAVVAPDRWQWPCLPRPGGRSTARCAPSGRRGRLTALRPMGIRPDAAGRGSSRPPPRGALSVVGDRHERDEVHARRPSEEPHATAPRRNRGGPRTRR